MRLPHQGLDTPLTAFSLRQPQAAPLAGLPADADAYHRNVLKSCLGAKHLYIILKSSDSQRHESLAEASAKAVCDGLQAAHLMAARLEVPLTVARSNLVRSSQLLTQTVDFWGGTYPNAHAALMGVCQSVIKEIIVASRDVSIETILGMHQKPDCGLKPAVVKDELVLIHRHFHERVEMPDPRRLEAEALIEAGEVLRANLLRTGDLPFGVVLNDNQRTATRGGKTTCFGGSFRAWEVFKHLLLKHPDYYGCKDLGCQVWNPDGKAANPDDQNVRTVVGQVKKFIQAIGLSIPRSRLGYRLNGSTSIGPSRAPKGRRIHSSGR